jgi:hypothetical protein
VLISPYALNNVIKGEKDLSVALTKKQIENSPSLDSHKPVSRQFEDDYYGYYGWPTYWSGSSMWGDYPYIERDRNKWGKFTPGTKTWDRHLRSSHAVTGYHLQALSGRRNKELVAWEKGPYFTAMDRARQLERVGCFHQPLARDHQGVTGIHGRVVANPGL